MAEGKAISLIPSASEVTTQQAADMLHVSRPHIVKLLEQGTIPFKKVGSHRRILLEDLLKYEAEQKEKKRENLQFLAEQAQELNIGYKWFTRLEWLSSKYEKHSSDHTFYTTVTLKEPRSSPPKIRF